MIAEARHLRPRPRLRGHLHSQSFFVSLALGMLLVAAADGGKATFAAGVFALSASAMLGVSGLFHRRTWSARGFSVMRRLDHAMIYLLIAGSYTPFALLALDGPASSRVLWIIWTCAAVGITLELVLAHAPAWIRTAICVTMGWVSLLAIPAIIDGAGTTPVLLLAIGGVLYTAGGVIYAINRPDPKPSVFGFHEVFHVFVVAALAFHYTAVAVVAVA